MNVKILKLESVRQPTGDIITLREIEMIWSALTNLCVERLVGEQVQEGWYGWEEDTLKHIWIGWEEFEHKIGSKEEK